MSPRGSEGLVIVDVTDPETAADLLADAEPGLRLARLRTTQDVIVASTNASLFAYVADGRNGLKVLQLTSPTSQPELLRLLAAADARADRLGAHADAAPCSVAKGLDRDRAVDETGGQIAVFGRLGSRPFNRSEMERLFLNRQGRPYQVTDTGSMEDWVGPRGAIAAR